MNVQQIMAAAAISVIMFQGLTIARAKKASQWLPTTTLVLVSLPLHLKGKLIVPLTDPFFLTFLLNFCGHFPNTALPNVEKVINMRSWTQFQVK